MTDSTITIEVDGQKLEAKPGQMLIEVTDAAGITVPRFCYHDKLSIAANCRMCLVDVDKVPKPLPACATPVNDGMVVHTKSPRALAAQKGTMEFLLINHPLDCPICDQGGECELQDVAMGYGSDVSRYAESKRVVTDPSLGALIATDLTRCIHCTRCVRFGAEIAGVREMGATGRGEHMKIGTYVMKTVNSEMSGNIIDLCPVGALTSKPSRYQARAWELTQRDGIAPHDCVGSNIHYHIRRDKVMRVVPRNNEAINECWISDRDRFSYEGIFADDRIEKPQIKQDGNWKTVGWEEALEAAATILSDAGENLASLVSPSSTLEEMYLTQKLTRALGSEHIDHRLRQTDFRNAAANPALPWLGQKIQQLETNNATLLIGSNIRKEQPILGHRIRKSALAGGAVMAINPVDYDFNFELAATSVVSPSALLAEVAAVAKAAGCKKDIAGLVGKADVKERHQQMADNLKQAETGIVLLGNFASSHPDFTLLRALAAEIADVTGVQYGVIPEASNSVGGWLTNSVPSADSNGHSLGDMLEHPHAAYLLVNIEPAYDVTAARSLSEKLATGKVVALSPYASESLLETADVILPVGTFAETSGAYANAQAEIQRFSGAMSPLGDARPAWKVLRVLGNLVDLDGFDYLDTAEILEELLAGNEPVVDNSLRSDVSGEASLASASLERVADVPLYSIDAIVRRAGALQHTEDAWKPGIRISPATAGKMNLETGDTVTLSCEGEQDAVPVFIDERVLDGTAWYPAAVSGSEKLGRLFGEITLTKG